MRCPACRCAALSLALLASAVLADTPSSTTTIYRWVDAQGVVHFSDAPQPGAQQLHVPPAQTYSAPPAPAISAPEAASGPVAAYQACTIVQPGSEQAFYAPDAVTISLQLAPALRPGDQITVRVDGKQLAPADDSGLDFQIDDPDRGTHTLTAMVRDADGMTVCIAPPVTFYVQRPSLLSPSSPARGGSPPRAH